MLHEATAIIHLDNIRHNFRVAREASPGKKIMVVVKGDGYGHGGVQVARALDEADCYAVARLKEALAIRQSGIEKPVCLLEGVLDEGELLLAEEYALDLVVHAHHQLPLLADRTGLRVWIKVDTGMGRLGFMPEELAQVADRLSGQHILGLMTHLSSADEPDYAPTEQQLECLWSIAGDYPVNIANSAGVIGQPIDRADWIRPGLMLYGGSPMLPVVNNPLLRPGMTFRAPVIAIRNIPKGSTVGYGRTWQAPHDCRVAVVAVGYADGYPREIAGNTPVLIAGQERTIVGRVSMDMISVLLQDDDEPAIGDAVTLWGEGLPIETIAVSAGTVPYTLMSCVTARVPRIYQEIAN